MRDFNFFTRLCFSDEDHCLSLSPLDLTLGVRLTKAYKGCLYEIDRSFLKH